MGEFARRAGGSVREGQDGPRRDSLCYSVLADEWPSLCDKLLTRAAAKATV